MPPPGSGRSDLEWNLRLAAAQRGIWRASDLRRLLADAGLEVSAGKMSHLWSGPADLYPARRPGHHLRGARLRARRAAGPRPRRREGSRPAGARRGRGGRAGDPPVTARGPDAAAGVSAWQPVTCTECGTTGPGRPGRGLCKRCYARAQHPVRPCEDCGRTRRQLAAGLCARLLPAVADPAGHLHCLRRAAPGLVRRPVRALQEARRGEGRGLPRLRQAGQPAVVGPLPQLRFQVPPGDRCLPRLRGPDRARERALQGLPGSSAGATRWAPAPGAAGSSRSAPAGSAAPASSPPGPPGGPPWPGASSPARPARGSCFPPPSRPRPSPGRAATAAT